MNNDTTIFRRIASFFHSFTLIAVIGLGCLLFLGSCSRSKRVAVGVSQCSYDDWRLKLNEEMQRQALLYDNLDLEIRSAYDDPVRQVEDIRYFIDKGVDVIVASPHNSHNLNEILAEARQKGIKVIDFDRLPSTKCYDIFVGADNVQLGRSAGEYLIERLPAGSAILELKGSEGSTPAGERSRGFHEAMEASGAMVLADSVRANWSATLAEKEVENALKRNTRIDAIFAHNDRMAIGAANALHRHGLDSIPIAGIDAVAETGMKAVEEGKIDVTFTYPTAGKELIDLAMKAASGVEVSDKFIFSSLQPVDKSNVGILLELSESINDEKSKIGVLQERINYFSSVQNLQRTLLIVSVALALLLAGLLFFILHAYWQRKKSQAELAERNRLLSQQRDELESLNHQLQEATQSKLRFFTNVSHDLRTPLTLIAEPLSTLSASRNLTPKERTLLQLAEKNVLILRRLINQILDFRKFENDRLQLALYEGDIRSSLDGWGEAFRPLARRRHIDYSLNLEIPSPMEMAFDAEKMERVFFNLMGNAFKFTPDNGKIRVEARIRGQFLQIVIANTGAGISPDDLPNIFDRFYQAREMMPQGSGIGLALVKSFVELHEGSVNVTSTQGKETVFTVEIPIRHVEERMPSGESSEGLQQFSQELADVEPATDDPEVSEIPPGAENPDRPTLLVIDDTRDIRTLLRTLLADEYTIIEAANGKQGIKLASKYSPDIIICDMMMPQMDGAECCRRIKEETSTSHIPILMLTACKLDEQRADAYEAGADGFISKPFSNDVLRARLHSLLANRRRLSGNQIMPAVNVKTENSGNNAEPTQKSVSKSTSSPRPASNANRNMPVDPLAVENEFYQHFMEIVDQELSNPDISVEEIGSRLGLSRVQFYRKIKALTNFSPVELIRIRRLNEAYKMLSKSEATVSEIAYSVGFSSPGYFSKCFKEQFGELPADLQRRTSKLK